MISVIAATAAMLMVGGGWLVLAGVTPTPARSASPRRREALLFTGARVADRRTSVAAGLGLTAGLVVALVSGWFVAVLVLPGAFAGIAVLTKRTQNREVIDQLEALEEWTRSLAGVLGAGVGLEQAIQATLSRSTPEAIRPQVANLVARLRSRWSTEVALRAFADELHDSTADAVIAGLILAASRRGRGLASMLEDVADRAAEDVRNRRRVEADLAKPRGTARWVTIITLGVLGLLMLNQSYIEPYGSAVGQVVLLVLLGSYAGAVVWMQRMAKGYTPPRLLGTDRAEVSQRGAA